MKMKSSNSLFDTALRNEPYAHEHKCESGLWPRFLGSWSSNAVTWSRLSNPAWTTATQSCRDIKTPSESRSDQPDW